MTTTTRKTLTATALAAVLSAGGVAAGAAGASAAPATTPVAASASAQLDQLVAMREEERMARDLYLALADSSGSPVFTRIARAEDRHLAAVDRLVVAAGGDPSTLGSTAGTYAVPQLQSRYDDWMATGTTSPEQAYQVGMALEQQDLADLKALDTSGDAELARVVSNLVSGSTRHLAAFTAAASGTDPAGGNGPGPAQRGGNAPGPAQRGGNAPGQAECDGGGAGSQGQGARQGHGPASRGGSAAGSTTA